MSRPAPTFEDYDKLVVKKVTKTGKSPGKTSYTGLAEDVNLSAVYTHEFGDALAAGLEGHIQFLHR